MEYKFTRDGKEETVPVEEWAWCAIFKDGTELRQFGTDGVFHQFQEAMAKPTDALIMYRPDDETKRFDVFLKEGMKPFHFYRHFVFAQGTAEETRAKVYCFGWKDARTGAAGYHYILPSGNMVIGADIDLGYIAAIVLKERMAARI